MSAATKAIQDDDSANAATLWVLDGAALRRAVGAAGRACADSRRGGAIDAPRGARYPAYDDTRQTQVDLEGRINISASSNRRPQRSGPKSKDLLALTAYVARQ